MKRDELKAILGEGATDEIVNAIMAEYGKGVNAANAANTDLQSQLADANAKIAEYETAANANLSNEEKWAKELKAANEAAAKSAHDLNEMCAIAEFNKAGLTEDEYTPFLAAVVGADRDTTVNAAKAIADTITTRAAKAKEEAEKAALENMTPPAGGNPAGDGLPKTKKEFMALSYSEQLKLKADNPQILSELK